MEPIFIGITRSFWAAMATAALILEMGDPVILAIATLIATVTGGDAASYAAWIGDVAPLVTGVWVLYERRGGNRPYTLDPRAVK